MQSPGGLEAARLRLFGTPPLRRRRLIIPVRVARALARLAGWCRPNDPEGIDAAIAEGERARLRGIDPRRLHGWQVEALLGLDRAAWIEAPHPDDEPERGEVAL